MNLILRLLLVVVPFILYYFFYSIKLNGNKYFFLIAYVSYVSIITYLSGIFNLLSYSKYIIFIVSILLLATYIKDIKKINIRSLVTIDLFLFFVITLVWLFIMTRNIGVSHWDDFSHWYRICKIMNFDNTFPTTNELIYKTYFPGTACWIYYITRFLSFNPSNCYFAQGMIVFAFCAPFLLVFSNKKPLYKLILTLIMVICLCSINSTFNVLLVDTLLGLSPICLYVLIKNINSKYDYYVVLLISSFTALIKASSIFFILVISIMWFIIQNKKRAYSALFIIFSLFLMSLYIIRNSFVYSNMASSGQSFYLSRFIEIFTSKSMEVNALTCKKFFISVLNVISGINQIKLMWVVLILLLVLQFVFKCKTKETTLIIGSTFEYLILLFLVYLFSMLEVEVSGASLASFDRYIATIDIYLLGYLFVKLGEINNVRIYIPTIACTLLFCILFMDTKFVYDKKVNGYTDQLWNELNTVSAENYEYTTTNYLIVYDKDNYLNDNSDKISGVAACFYRSMYIYILPTQNILDGISEEEKTFFEAANVVVNLSDFNLSNIQ